MSHILERCPGFLHGILYISLMPYCNSAPPMKPDNANARHKATIIPLFIFMFFN